MDGLVVEQLTSLDAYVSGQTPTMPRRGAWPARPKTAAGARFDPHFKTSSFGAAKALNEGLFHVLVLAFAVYLAVDGRISFGDLTLSILF